MPLYNPDAVSAIEQTALDLKANLASPTFTGLTRYVSDTEAVRLVGANPYFLAKNGAQSVDLGFLQFTTALAAELWVPDTGSFKVTVDAASHTFTETGLNVTGLVQCDSFRIDAAPTLETVVATHTVTFSANGTNYKLLCLVA